MKITIPYNKIIVIATISIVGLQRVAAHAGVRAGEFGLCRSELPRSSSSPMAGRVAIGWRTAEASEYPARLGGRALVR